MTLVGTEVALGFGTHLPSSWVVANPCPVMGAAPMEGVCTELMLTTFFPK